MQGAVAAGHPLTAEAGARVLREGGNAVDACVGAALVSWVCESPLTGPGGGGFMLLHDAASRTTRLLDFFVAVPRARTGDAELPGGAEGDPVSRPAGGGSAGVASSLVELAVDFDGDTAQTFRTGAAAVGVPGTALGLEEAHRWFGSLPWAELAAPAARLAREGFELTPAQGYLHRILDGLLRHSPEGDAMYGPGGPVAAGERFAEPALAETLERLAAEGAAALYRGELAERLVAHVQAGGGRLALDDLASYRVTRRRPLAVAFHGHELRTNPPPSSGGALVGLGLRALGDAAPTPLAIAASMDAQAVARGPALLRNARRLLSGTTHISVVDARGDVASLSCSLGSGSGVVVPGTGIHLNNMLGEADLVAGGAGGRPGERLTSMMAPSLVLCDGRPRLVVGSAGSARLRGAILQVVANVTGGGMGVAEAVEAPRIHVEDGVAHCEDGAAADALEAAGYPVVRFRRRNLYFGGVSAVEVRADGSLAAAGDPRRGGAGVVVS